jgi:hypothetical protein
MRNFIISVIAALTVCAVCNAQSIPIGNPMDTTNAYFAFPHTRLLQKGMVTCLVGQNQTNNVTDSANFYVSNNMYSVWNLLKGGNDAGGTTTGAVNYVQMYAIASDVTGGTEDGKLDIYIMVNGTLTKAFTIDLNGITVVGNIVSAGGAYTNGGATMSNNTGLVACSNLIVVAGGTVQLPADSVSATYLTAGTSISAVNGNAATNLSAANIAAGTSITAINGYAATNLNAASLKVGTSLPAVNGSGVTNISAANVAAGTSISAINGNAATNLAAANLAGNVAFGRITNAFTSITGTFITNTCSANLAGTQTNTYVFAPVGGAYVLYSITTSP